MLVAAKTNGFRADHNNQIQDSLNPNIQHVSSSRQLDMPRSNSRSYVIVDRKSQSRIRQRSGMPGGQAW